MKLRRFNQDGLGEFAGYRASLAVDSTLPPPKEMLEESALTELLRSDVDITQRLFANRLEAGTFLNDLLERTGILAPERDAGLWAWLTLFYFDEVCPPDGNGRRYPKDEARLVPIVDNFQRFYRHLLLGPYRSVRRPWRTWRRFCIADLRSRASV